VQLESGGVQLLVILSAVTRPFGLSNRRRLLLLNLKHALT
jgi:hypothetical protein